MFSYWKHSEAWPILQELMHHRMMSLVTRLEQRCSSIVSNRIDVSSILEQDFYDVIVSHLTSNPQRRRAIIPWYIGIGTGGQQHE